MDIVNSIMSKMLKVMSNFIIKGLVRNIILINLFEKLSLIKGFYILLQKQRSIL